MKPALARLAHALSCSSVLAGGLRLSLAGSAVYRLAIWRTRCPTVSCCLILYGILQQHEAAHDFGKLLTCSCLIPINVVAQGLRSLSIGFVMLSPKHWKLQACRILGAFECYRDIAKLDSGILLTLACLRITLLHRRPRNSWHSTCTACPSICFVGAAPLQHIHKPALAFCSPAHIGPKAWQESPPLARKAQPTIPDALTRCSSDMLSPCTARCDKISEAPKPSVQANCAEHV